jgi:hypothetical protein
MMTSDRRFMVCSVGLAAGLWCAVGASAHELSATSQSGGPGQSTSVQHKSTIDWDAIEWTEHRYKIEALSFKARDESGIDSPWSSDEVIIRTDDAKGWTVSDKFGDVDSGETHKLDPARSCIIAVRPGIVVLGKTSVCDDAGEPAPFWFAVNFWEKDPGPLFSFCLVPPPSPGFHAGPYCDQDGNDDFLGRARIDLSQQDLDAVLPHVGDEYIETVVLNPCDYDESVCDVTYGPDYSFTYRITRLPDVRVDLRPVLDEAMRKVGARSELEAIVAGLRSLRTPSPRQIEPGIGK